MSRIARRTLRIQALPLFSLGKPWQSVCDAGGVLALRLFEPRYVELARRVFPPAGDRRFGYAETYPPKVGTAGVLAQVEDFRWADVGGGSAQQMGQEQRQQQVALMSARAARRFRILAVWQEEIAPSKPPLFLANVQLLEDRDVARGPGRDAWDYWARPVGGTGEGAGLQRANTVKPGTALVARLGAPVFEALDSWTVVAQVPLGVAVVAAGPPRMVEGYLMVPIVPSGAVELTLFRELTTDGEAGLPSEQELRATLLNLEKGPAASSSREGHSEKGEVQGRKSWGRRRS